MGVAVAQNMQRLLLISMLFFRPPFLGLMAAVGQAAITSGISHTFGTGQILDQRRLTGATPRMAMSETMHGNRTY